MTDLKPLSIVERIIVWVMHPLWHSLTLAALAAVVVLNLVRPARAPEPIAPSQDQHAVKIAALSADTARLAAELRASNAALDRTRDSLTDARELNALAHDSLEAQADEYSAWEDARRALVPRPRVEAQGGVADAGQVSHGSDSVRTLPPVDCGVLLAKMNAALKHDDALFASDSAYEERLRTESRAAVDSVRAVDARLVAEKDAQLAEAAARIAALTQPPNIIVRTWDVVKYPLLATVSFIAGVKAGLAVR